MDRADLEAKFRDCVAFSGVAWDAYALLDALWQVESHPPFPAFQPAPPPAARVGP